MTTNAQPFARVLTSGLACVALGWLSAAPAAAVDAVESVTVRDDNGNGRFFSVDFENNYLPNVVLRENGAASFEALKAQAVAARSFTYYKLETGSSFLRNSEADQVYSVDGQRSNPGGAWERAVRETEGEFLSFNNVTTAAFYVAGAIPTSSSGIAGPGDSDRPTRSVSSPTRGTTTSSGPTTREPAWASSARRATPTTPTAGR